LAIYYTYIIYKNDNSLLHIGVTNDLSRRLKLIKIKYTYCCKLVYYEEFTSSAEATNRENKLLQIHETLIEELVKETNPMLINLSLKNKKQTNIQ